MTRRYDIRRQRNLGIIAHVDAGKTTLTERILALTGAIRTSGDVHHGNTTTDFDASERAHGITINAASVSTAWEGHQLQLIDTPGHIDFGIEVERSLRVLDGAVVVLDAVAGVEAQTESVWRMAERHGVPRICFVNKMDRAGADLDHVLAMIRERFDVEPVLLTAPIGTERDFVGVADLVGQCRITWRDGVREVRTGLDHDASVLADEVAALCRDLGGAVTTDDRWRCLREATLAGLVVPVLCGSAYKHRGIEPLLDAIVSLLPSPADREPVAEGRPPVDDAPALAFCFNQRLDKYGQLAFVRVHSGVLSRGMQVINARTGKRLRIGRLLHVFADRTDEVHRLNAGEIGAIVGIDVATGDTLTDPTSVMALEPIEVPEPVMRVALSPSSRREQATLALALQKLTATDPSLRLETDAETGQTVLAGRGELHLAIALERLAAEGLEVRAMPPRVSYREALGSAAEATFTLSKQTGGPGAYAKVTLRVAPATEGAGLVFTDALRGEELPRHYLGAIEAGIRSAMTTGPLRGYPINDATVTLLGGKAHDNDSNDDTFRIAASRAFMRAAVEAEPHLLEPRMQLAINAPDDRIGDVVGDVGRRRGRVLGMTPGRREVLIDAEAPLAELFGYAGALRSLTGGRGTFSMALRAFTAVPKKLAKGVT